MIIKTGIDVLKKFRLRKILNSNTRARFIKKILSIDEFQDLQTIQNEEKILDFMSKKFCTKEAIAKAIGVGIYNEYLKFSDIYVSKNEYGAPIFNKNEKIDDLIYKIYKIKNYSISVSISDEDDIVVANAILLLIN